MTTQDPFFHSFVNREDPFRFQQAPLADFVDAYDCSLGSWGPFSKSHFGISHLPGPSGLRVDWMVVPELHRRRFLLPSALKESGYLPWSANPDLTRYSYRQFIEGAEGLYADISFDTSEPGRCRVSVRMVNETPLAHDLRLHLAAKLQPPAAGAWNPREFQSLLPPEGGLWIDALAYAESTLGELPGPPGLARDGCRRGESVGDGLVDAQAVLIPAQRSGKDRIVYRVEPEAADRWLHLRHLLPEGPAEMRVLMAGETQVFDLKDEGFAPAVKLPAGCEEWTLTYPGNRELLLDGLWISDSATPPPPLKPVVPDPAPVIEGKGECTATLCWPDMDLSYQVEGEKDLWIRRYRGDVEACFLLSQHNHVTAQITGPGRGEAVDFILPMDSVPAGGEQTRTFTISGPDLPGTFSNTEPASELPEGAPFRFGQQRLAAVLMTNVVYPVRIKGRVIRHHPPGRWWDSLYTWDCGFIGLGLAEVSPRRALEMLNTYVTDPGDPECAFIHHGSPVPVQHYLYQDLWQKTGDREMLAFFYPRLAQYLRYLANLTPFGHSLTSTWDLFYNSGGWDDYPPQQWLDQHSREERTRTCPMAPASHLAAAARIMAMAAAELALENEGWEELIQKLSRDLESQAWDEEEGIYGYVSHDASGKPEGLLKHPVSGRNFNLGLDGALPLLGGDLSPERAERLWMALENEERFFTELGLATVDQTAPYASPDGYWNGAVWMPYQYLFWKSALDYGRVDFARELARRVLKIWDRETRDGHGCFEHFMIQSGRGAGWHHFGGLSSPLLNLYAAYYVPGRINCGFRTWVQSAEWSSDLRKLTCRLRCSPLPGKNVSSVLICLDPGWNGDVTLNGEPVKVNSPWPGLVEVSLHPVGDIQELHLGQVLSGCVMG